MVDYNPSFSICMITKDEAAMLDHCLSEIEKRIDVGKEYYRKAKN